MKTWFSAALALALLVVACNDDEPDRDLSDTSGAARTVGPNSFGAPRVHVTIVPQPTVERLVVASYEEAESFLGYRLLRHPASNGTGLAASRGGASDKATAIEEVRVRQKLFEVLHYVRNAFSIDEFLPPPTSVESVGPFSVSVREYPDSVVASFETGENRGGWPIVASVSGPDVASLERFIAELTFHD